MACVKRLGLLRVQRAAWFLPPEGPGWLGMMGVRVQAPQSLSEGFWPALDQVLPLQGPSALPLAQWPVGRGSPFRPWGSGGGPSASFRLLAGCPLASDPVSLPKGSLELGGWSAGPAPLLLGSLSQAGLPGFPPSGATQEPLSASRAGLAASTCLSLPELQGAYVDSLGLSCSCCLDAPQPGCHEGRLPSLAVFIATPLGWETEACPELLHSQMGI